MSFKITKREAQILNHISLGLRTKEIAEDLNLSEHTIDTYRKILFQKLKAINAPSLVRKGFELGILRPSEKQES